MVAISYIIMLLGFGLGINYMMKHVKYSPNHLKNIQNDPDNETIRCTEADNEEIYGHKV